MDQLIHTIPSREQIKTFPDFQNLAAENMIVVHSISQCQELEHELKTITLFGFDTESKPTFNKGEIQTGPHLIQLASIEKAYLFQVSNEILNFLKPIFENKAQIKVGFGLKNDAHLFRKKGIELHSTVELSKCFASFGLTDPVGIKNAMALLFQVNFHKSKSISTSNWARKVLTPQQIDYAAADAYAALMIYQELIRRQILK